MIIEKVGAQRPVGFSVGDDGDETDGDTASGAASTVGTSGDVQGASDNMGKSGLIHFENSLKRSAIKHTHRSFEEIGANFGFEDPEEPVDDVLSAVARAGALCDCFEKGFEKGEEDELPPPRLVDANERLRAAIAAALRAEV